MTDYRPVDCDTHSRYEEAVLLRKRLRLKWRAPDDSVREAQVKPMDVVTKDGEEFLIARTMEGEELQLRLDCILQSEPE